MAPSGAPVDSRTLVVVELEGGNDGLATLVPFGNPRLFDLRPTLAQPDAELVEVDDGWGVHPGLAKAMAHQPAFVRGIGALEPDYSHFEMSRRWWDGDPTGETRPNAGALGRICDVLDQGAALTGVSLSNGPSPSLFSETTGTGVVPDPGSAWFLNAEDELGERRREALVGLGTSTGANPGSILEMARRSIGETVDLADLLLELDEEEDYEGSDLERRMRFAARLIDAELGIRVIHINHGGFDTHSYQRDAHDQLMDDLGLGLGALLDGLESTGRSDEVLVATTSEFGRRATENNSEGTDHGGPSVGMLWGPVSGGLYGEPESLDNLDDEGQMASTRSFTDYQAIFAEWFDLDPDEVITPGATAVEGVLA
jgi:uncharacterized protein (DUF1501 family)